MIKICVECGAEFKPQGMRPWRKVACSPECQRLRNVRSEKKYRDTHRDEINARARERFRNLTEEERITVRAAHKKYRYFINSDARKRKNERYAAQRRARRVEIREANGWIFGKHRNGRPKKPHTCTNCGTIFYINKNSYNQKCCSHECAEIRKAAQILKMKQNIKPHECAHCKKTFFPEGALKNHKYCSPECVSARRSEVLSNRNKEWAVAFAALQILLSKGVSDVDVR